MNLKKTLRTTPLPDRDPFYNRLQTELFPAHQRLSFRRWLSVGVLASAAAIVIGIAVQDQLRQPNTALASALPNTFTFTHSDQLMEETLRIERYLGSEQSANPDIGVTTDEHGKVIPPSAQQIEESQLYLLGRNMRTHEVYKDDTITYTQSTLESSVAGMRCLWTSLEAARIDCSDLSSNLPYPAMVNDDYFTVEQLTVTQTGDPQGDLQLIWKTKQPLGANVFVDASTGPSGYVSSGYQPHSQWTDAEGYHYSQVGLHSSDLRLNASSNFYPEQSHLLDIQLIDDAGKSQVYLLNLDTLTATPLNDSELLKQQLAYEGMVEDYSTSTERLSQYHELLLGNVAYLQDHLRELQLQAQTTDAAGLIIETYAVPAKLQLYGGTNQALVTTASFTINPTTQRVTGFQFKDSDGKLIEAVDIQLRYPTTDPSTIFSKEAWLASLN